MKRTLKQVLILFFCIGLMFLYACGGTKVPANTVVIWGVGGKEETAYLAKLKTDFNNANSDVKMHFIVKDSYESILNEYRNGIDLPDIVYIDDEYFKRMVQGDYLQPLEPLFSDSTLDINEMWPTAISRYRYNAQNNTNSENDALYCIPKDVSPTVLFYNKGLLESAGIKVISVDEKDIEAFNNNTLTDLNGKKKSDYQISVDVRAKGYQRQIPYKQGSSWEVPLDGEVLIFNNRIPMNWDEIEDLAMLFTKLYNPKSPTTYGYYTEWWFNYGWSVGGDCVGDQNGEGEWVFTLNDANTNYKVLEDVSVNGTNYKASTTENVNFISYKDKKYLKDNLSVLSQISDKLQQLPSTKQAFERFCALSRKTDTLDPKGIEVTASPSNSPNVTDALSKFNLGAGTHTAMFVGYSYMANSISNKINWDMAPLPIYKSYASDGYSIDKIGARAGHSKCVGYAISKSSTKKDIAVKVLEYIAGDEGQKVAANSGYNLPNTKKIAMSDYIKSNSGRNFEQAVIEAQYQLPGDWWYMPERSWIANWSQPLNQDPKSVRNSGQSLTTYFDSVVERTNNDLKRFW